MDIRPRAIAALQMALLSPAALFMTALVVRTLGPLQDEPAHSAQQIVMLYAGRVWTLWVLLLALPIAVLTAGCATLLRGWRRDAEPSGTAPHSLAVTHARPARVVVAATTLAAAGILAIVVLHMLAN